MSSNGINISGRNLHLLYASRRGKYRVSKSGSRAYETLDSRRCRGYAATVGRDFCLPLKLNRFLQIFSPRNLIFIYWRLFTH